MSRGHVCARTVASLALLWGLMVATASLAAAQSTEPDFGQASLIVTPTFQEVVLDASASAVTSTLTVTNKTSQPLDFEVFPVAISQIDSRGGVMLADKPLTGTTHTLAGYIEVLEPTFQILPQESKDIAVRISNSLNLSPGGHYASLIVRTVSPAAEQPSNQSVLPALSSFMLVRKTGGEQYNLFLSKLLLNRRRIWTSFPTLATLTFENQGNVHTIPRGQVSITDLFGRTVLEGTVNEGSLFVLPRSQREVMVRLRQIRPSWPLMVYRVTVAGASDPGAVPYQVSQFSVYGSWQAAASLVGAFGLIAVLIVVWKKRTRSRRHHDTQ